MPDLKTPRELELARTSLTARVENTEVGVCPVCHSTMNVAKVGDLDCYVCLPSCRICLPLKDDANLSL